MNKNYIFGVGILLAVLLAFTAPATARMDDATFYLNASDSSHEVSVLPGEEVTIYLDVSVPVNSTAGFEVGVMIDPNVVECLDVTENTSLTDWYLWTFRGVWDSGFEDGKKYINFDSWDPLGIGPAHLRCGDIRLRGVNPGTTILYLGLKDVDIEDGDNNTIIIDTEGTFKDWTLAENFTFTCVGEADTFTKPLGTDWNLVSLPLIADDMTSGSVLASISGSYDSVMRYDSSAHSFVAVEDTDTMVNGVGYFVHVTTAGTWSYEGQPYTSINSALSTGLNCVGWTNETGSALPGALSSIDGSYRYVARWNAGTQSYEVYLPGAPAAFNDFTTMDRGEGYFIAATEGCTLAYP